MKAKDIGKKAIKTLNSIVNFVVLTVIVLLVAFALYALWDSSQVYQVADKTRYEVYKPTAENQGKSFQELQAINPEVIAWLSVFGTNIDYPVTQGPDNMKYVTTNAEGRYSLSGAIFLDTYNNKDFSDFNSLLYGHHMEKKAMFGEIGGFVNQNIFDAHQYGAIYYDGKMHGIEFFAFVHADAYDNKVFTPAVPANERQAYLADLMDKAVNLRDIGANTNDRLILLTTCSSSSTNGRDILVGRISDEVFADPFDGMNSGDGKGGETAVGATGSVREVSWLPLLLIPPIVILLIVISVKSKGKRKRKNTLTNPHP